MPICPGLRLSPSSSSRAESGFFPSPGPYTKYGCTRLAWRVCICVSARWPAAGCAGRTAGRISAPRSSVWSRPRRSKTPSSCRPARRAVSLPSACPIRPQTATRGWPKASRRTGFSLARCSMSRTTSSTGRSSRPREWFATTATTRTSSSRRTKEPRRSPTSPTPSRAPTGSGWATPSPPAVRPGSTTRRWESQPAGRGSRSSGTSANSGSTPSPRSSRP